MHRFLAAEELQSHFENVRGAGCKVRPEWANGGETFILQEVEVGAERVRPEWANGAETFVLGMPTCIFFQAGNLPATLWQALSHRLLSACLLKMDWHACDILSIPQRRHRRPNSP